MSEVKFTNHNGTKILLLDFSYSEGEDILKTIKEAEQIISAQPHDSVLSLVDVRGGIILSKGLTAALKGFAMHNKPYMKMSVVVGVEGLKKIIYQGVLFFTNRKNIILRNSLEEAKDFLT